MSEVPTVIVEAVNRYHDEYRNPSLPRPDVSGLYALFPNEAPSHDPDCSWPKNWPYTARPGAYVVLGKEK